MIRYLSRHDIEGLSLAPGAIADAIETALRAADGGAARNLPKSTIALPDGRLYQAAIAAGIADPAPAFAAVKVLGLAPANAAAGLPHMGGLIVLLARETGLPVAVLEAGWITDHRTAALTLVAARRLARRSASSIGFVGCGAQARAHLAALLAEFPLREVAACSRSRASRDAFADFARGLGLEARSVGDPAEAVRGCDIVVSSVPAGPDVQPMLHAGDLADGAFAALVDLGRSWHDAGFDGIRHRVTDDRAQSEGKTARRLTPVGPYTADLADLVCGRSPGRQSEAERAVFVFQGLAMGDLAAAALAFDAASARNIGTLLPR